MNLCSNPDDKLQIYRDNFEKAYMDSTERFYRTQAPAYLQQNGVQNYMKYVRLLHWQHLKPIDRILVTLLYSMRDLEEKRREAHLLTDLFGHILCSDCILILIVSFC